MSRERDRKPTPERLQALSKLSSRLGLTAVSDTQLQLLHQALTTAAWIDQNGGGDHNKPLEFFGDAVWEHAITEHLLESHRRLSLATRDGMHSQLKSGHFQTGIAKTLGLDTLILVPDSFKPKQQKTKLETREVLIGSALEACLGAIATHNVREALSVAKALIRPHADRLARIHAYKNPVYKGDANTWDQVHGFTRLSLVLTRELMRMMKNGTLLLRGAHQAREQVLSHLGLIKLAERIGITGETDIIVIRKLLAILSRGRKSSPTLKAITHACLQDRLNALIIERGYLVKPPDNEPHTSGLKAFLNGNAAKLIFETRPYGSRGVRTICLVNGVKVGEATGEDPKKVKEEAALAALNNPRIGEIRDNH